ncbi:444_t:CDS:2 [Ambispora leptoticha]|uniref:444_t:CDS:1 n=1 Tax=Ambispora leptoticha TaxID=144679 RepID=A0A9N9CBT1_9GLOM|nr:444_t:CDS:2 [Ambispora leptoticha]
MCEKEKKDKKEMSTVSHKRINRTKGAKSVNIPESAARKRNGSETDKDVNVAKSNSDDGGKAADGRTYEWCLKSVECSNLDEQCNHGFCYENGIEDEADEH